MLVRSLPACERLMLGLMEVLAVEGYAARYLTDVIDAVAPLFKFHGLCSNCCWLLGDLSSASAQDHLALLWALRAAQVPGLASVHLQAGLRWVMRINAHPV